MTASNARAVVSWVTPCRNAQLPSAGHDLLESSSSSPSSQALLVEVPLEPPRVLEPPEPPRAVEPPDPPVPPRAPDPPVPPRALEPPEPPVPPRALDPPVPPLPPLLGRRGVGGLSDDRVVEARRVSLPAPKRERPPTLKELQGRENRIAAAQMAGSKPSAAKEPKKFDSKVSHKQKQTLLSKLSGKEGHTVSRKTVAKEQWVRDAVDCSVFAPPAVPPRETFLVQALSWRRSLSQSVAGRCDEIELGMHG